MKCEIDMTELLYAVGDVPNTFFNDYKDHVHWGVDIETDGLDVLQGHKAQVVTLWSERERFGIYIRLTNVLPTNLYTLLCMTGKKVIFHYAMFDVPFLYKQFGILPFSVYDTKIAAKICDPWRLKSKQSLRSLLQYYTIAEIDKNDHIRCGDWSQEPTREMLQYAQNDVQYLWTLHQRQMLEMNHSQRVAYDEARNTISTLAQQKIEFNGGLYGY